MREYSIDPFELLRVSEVMVKDVDTLPANMRIDDAVAFFSGEKRRHKSYPILDRDGGVVGLLGRSDGLQWRSGQPHGEETLFDRASDRSLTIGYPDEPVSHLADRMVAAEVGRVPILDRQTARLAGFVSRKDLLRIRTTAKSAEAQRASYLTRRPGTVAPNADLAIGSKNI